MEGEMEERTINTIPMIMLAVLALIVVAILIDVIWGGEGSFTRQLVCGMVLWLPGGSVSSAFLGCAAVPV